MITVLIKRGKNGMLLSCITKGHAGYARSGSDIVCSAVSVLVRTTLQVLESLKGLQLETDIPGRGYVGFTVKNNEFSSSLESELVYAGNFLETGIKSVSNEYPDFVKLEIIAVE